LRKSEELQNNVHQRFPQARMGMEQQPNQLMEVKTLGKSITT